MVEKTAVVQVLGDHAAQVEVIAGRGVGQSYLLSAGTFVIGREADADLQLVEETGVSRVHAKIVAEGQRYRLIDNESRNGTILNGTPIRDALLNNGDTITIAQCQLRFRQMGTPRAAKAASFNVIAPPSSPQAAVAPVPKRSVPEVAIVLAGVTATVLVIGVVGTIFFMRGRANQAVAAAPSPPPGPVAAPPTAPAPPAPPPAPFLPLEVMTASEIVRSFERGKVATVNVAAGDRVKAGDALAILGEEGGNQADIATRKESIAALEVIAEGNEAVIKQLDKERAELKAVLSRSQKKKLAAPRDGVVAELALKVGDSVRQGQVLGKLETTLPTMRARVSDDEATGYSVGGRCALKRSNGGEVLGTLTEKTPRGDGQTDLVIDIGGADDVVEVRCAK